MLARTRPPLVLVSSTRSSYLAPRIWMRTPAPSSLRFLAYWVHVLESVARTARLLHRILLTRQTPEKPSSESIPSLLTLEPCCLALPRDSLVRP